MRSRQGWPVGEEKPNPTRILGISFNIKAETRQPLAAFNVLEGFGLKGRIV